MERLTLEAQAREGTGKGVARKLRRQGRVPAVLYGRKRQPLPLILELKAIREALHTAAGMNVLLDLQVRGNGQTETATAVVKDLQRDVLTREIIHVDLLAVSLEEKLEIRVPVVVMGQAKGLSYGGILEQQLRDLLVACLPTDIPDHIEVNATELNIGDAVHVRDLQAPAGVTILTPPEEVAVSILAPVKEEVAPAAPTAEAAAAAAAAAPAEGAKPEEKEKEKE